MSWSDFAGAWGVIDSSATRATAPDPKQATDRQSHRVAPGTPHHGRGRRVQVTDCVASGLPSNTAAGRDRSDPGDPDSLQSDGRGFRDSHTFGCFEDEVFFLEQFGLKPF